MSKLELKYVDSFEDRHGIKRRYFRRGKGQRIILNGEVGSHEFNTAYADAMRATAPVRPAAAPSTLKEPQAGTFKALAHLLFASPRFKKLAPSTRSNYEAIIGRFCEHNGNNKVADFKRADLIKIMGDMSDRPGAANNLLKRIRNLIRFAIDLEWIAADPTLRIETYDEQEFHTWTEAEIALFQAHWPVGTRERLAFDTLLYTAQRVSDAYNLSKPDRENKIRLVQQKTKKKTGNAVLTLGAHPGLVASIAAVPNEHAIINVTSFGRRWAKKSFANFVHDAIVAVPGLPHGEAVPREERCVAHGLRKAAARRLAQAGCTAHEIMALTGHRTLAEVERYTRAVEQEKLNAQAMAKLAAAE